MRRDDVGILFDYMYWVNHRLLDHAKGVPNEEFLRDSGVTTRDLRATLVHELDVEWSWRESLRGRLSDDDAELSPADYPDVSSLSEHWLRDEGEMRSWLASLSDADLADEVYAPFIDERRPLWVFLLHIVTHAAQQQADAATLLSLADASPGELTFLEYVSSR
jgi:uncharacterized damage-inducible protein DinB